MTAAVVYDRDRSVVEDWRWAALMHALVAAVLVLVVWQSSERLVHGEEGLSPRVVTLDHADGVLGPWVYWDAKYYAEILEDGYPADDRPVFESGGETLVAFFPGYPLLAGGLAWLGLGTGLGLVLLTLGAGFGSTILLHGWFTSTLSSGTARWASLAVATFPWAYFLVATAYPEALFLLLAVSAFVLVERDRPVQAGVLAAVASMTRLIGVGLILGLAVRVAERRGALVFDGWRPRVDLSRLRRRDAGVLLGSLGIGGWMLFCWLRYGDPMAFSTAQRGWSQGFGARSLLKLGLIEQLQDNQDRMFVLRLLLQGLVMVLFALALPAVWRRFGAGYGTYAVVAVALPLLGSANFASNGRFALMAFPVFGLLGERLAKERPRGAYALVAVTGIALVAVASLWGRGHWMS